MVVRKMTRDDVNAVYELSVACFSEPWSLDSIKQEVENPVASYFVAEQDGKIVGYSGLWHVLDEGEIINIAVSKQVRRQGIGALLLDKLLEEARQYALTVIRLEVRKSNEAAQSLYERYGFKAIAVRKGYYHKPLEDAVIMSYKI